MTARKDEHFLTSRKKRFNKLKPLDNRLIEYKHMYTLRTIKKSERMNAFNQSLGENYHLIDRHNETYNELRVRHFKAMGFSEQEIAGFNNPFVVGKDFSMPIYLEDGNEYYIMTESGKTFENLSGLVNGEFIKFSNEKESEVEILKGGFIFESDTKSNLLKIQIPTEKVKGEHEWMTKAREAFFQTEPNNMSANR